MVNSNCDWYLPIVDKPNKNVNGDQSKTLFVARLGKDTSQGIKAH